MPNNKVRLRGFAQVMLFQIGSSNWDAAGARWDKPGEERMSETKGNERNGKERKGNERK
jgi:hypothetical protein